MNQVSAANQAHQLRRVLWLYLALVVCNVVLAYSQEEKESDDVLGRMHWFYEQRSYPNDSLEQGYLLKAYKQYKEFQTTKSRTQLGEASSVTWIPIGPAPLSLGSGILSGRVPAIALHPTDPDIAFIGAADGGVWKTTNGGSSWISLTDDQPSLASGAIAIDPSNPSIVYWGTGEPYASADSYGGIGILKSVDAGETWTVIGLTNEKRITKIAINPLNTSTLLVSTYGGVYRSTDGGASWTKTSTFSSAWDIAIDPSNPSVCYAGASGMYKSTDGGVTWSKLTNGIPSSTSNLALALAPSLPSTVYVLVSNSTFYKSTDAGASWTSISLPTSVTNILFQGQGWYDITIGVAQNDPNIVLIGGVYLFRSTDGGSSWSLVSSQQGPDNHCIAVGANGLILLGNDAGVHKSTDNGATFSDINTTLAITQFYSLGLDQLHPGDIWGGAQDQGTSVTTGSLVWNRVFGGDGGIVNIDQTNSNLVYTEIQYGSHYRSTDGGKTFFSANGGISESGSWVTPTVQYPVGGGTVYTGTSRLYRTTDTAKTWSPTASSFPWGSSLLRQLGIPKTSPETIYASPGSTLYRSSDAGVTWTNISTGLPGRIITSIVPDNVNASLVYLTVSGSGTAHIFKSTDAGNSWASINGHYPTDLPANSIAIDPTNGSNLYVGTDLGVWTTGDGGTTWLKDDGFPNSAVLMLGVTSDNYLVAATHGRSMFKAQLGSTVPSISVISPNGGENWAVGSNHNITWSSNLITNVKIEYSTNSGSSWSTIIGSTPASANSYAWTVPNTTTTQGLVRISDASNASTSDVSSAAFTISPPPSVTVTSPNGGESWNVGSIHPITWTDTVISNIKIEYSTNNGSSWNTITASTAASAGSYSWTVPNTPTTQALVRVSDASNAATNDVSNGVFAIAANPTITVSSPNGGENWTAGTSHGITWTSNLVTKVMIEYSTNNGSAWSTIASSVQASLNSYGWTVPNTPTSQALVRISDTSNAATNDVSNAAFTISPQPSVTVTSPNGGEFWNTGSVHPITWTNTAITNVKIEYSTNNGSSWNTITASTAASAGSFSWTVPNSPSSQALVRISDASNASTNDISNAVFTIAAIPSITVSSPNGGENWTAGSTQNITWTSSLVTTVKIEYSTNSGSSWITVVSRTAASSNSYSWTVPNSPTAQALVRISDSSNATTNDISNAVFTISPPPSVTVTSPNGGESWNVGSSHPITWTSASIANVKIEYSTDGGTSWNTIIASTTASTGTYSWTVPNTPTAQALVRISDASNPATNDLSNATFTIAAIPSVSVVSPNGGENWSVGSAQSITWTSSEVTNVKIEYSTNNGSSWSTIVSSTPALANSYSWIVPNTPTTQGLVRISDTANAGTSDVSNASFTIKIPNGIVVISPNGGEIWNISSVQTIKWSSSGVNNVRIKYTTDNGTTWSTIVSSTPASPGSYTWTVPNTPTNSARVQIGTSNGSVTDMSDSTFTIGASNSLTLLSPAGGESWYVGTTQYITWSSYGIQNVNLDYSTDAGSSWNAIASGVPAASASYSWIIPNTTTTEALVRISDQSNPSLLSINATPFSIAPPPTVKLHGPKAGAKLVAGRTYPLLWASQSVGSVDLAYSTDNGFNWTVIDQNIPSGDTPYLWTVPTVPTSKALLRVSDVVGLAQDQSDSAFDISVFQYFVPITCSGSLSEHDTLWLGSANDATDGIDTALGEIEFPQTPQPGSFDARWQIPGTNGTTVDVRDTLSAVHAAIIYTGEIQPGSTGYPCILSWGALAPGIWHLRDTKTHGSVLNLFMRYDDSVIIRDSSLASFEILHEAGEKFTLQVNSSWNLLSLPFAVTDNRTSVVFPGVISKTFLYRNGSYQPLDTVPTSLGFWVKFSSPESLECAGESRLNDTLDLAQGWNLIGSVSQAIAEQNVLTDPPGIITSPLFGYQAGYVVSDSIQPGAGYWLRVSQAGKLLLTPSTPRQAVQRQRPAYDPSGFSTLQFASGIGASQNLYFGSIQISGQPRLEFYDLPPQPPVGAFDVRYSTQRSLALFDNGKGNNQSQSIILRSATYPVSVSWQMRKGENLSFSLVDSTSSGEIKVIALSHSGSGLVNAPGRLYLETVTDNSSPKVYSLGQNYPNPFNPATTMVYSIPKDSRVRIEVYNISGELVQTIIDEVKEAGTYSIQWNAQRQPSGIYFYRLLTGEPLSQTGFMIRETKKMVLVK